MQPIFHDRILVAFVLSLVAILAPSLHAAPANQSTPGNVEQVTLYRGQALITRRVPVAAGAGSIELVVSGLPDQVVGDSLFAETSDEIQIRAVRYRTRAVGEEPRQEIRQLDAQLEETAVRLATAQKLRAVTERQLQFLDKLENFVAPTVKAELTKGVLNAETLERLTEFSFDKREAAVKRLLELEQQEKEINRELTLLQRKRQELAGDSSKTVREAVLFLEKADPAAGSLLLKYLVGNCGWSPSYNFRAQPGGEKVDVEYNAIVRQMSGEDWNDVELTLSTASANLSAKGPGLAPFRVMLAPAAQKGQDVDKKVSSSKLEQQLKSIQGRRGRAQRQQSEALDLRQNLGSSVEFNAAAYEYQALELLAGKEALSSLRQIVPGEADGPSLSYPLDGKVSMASRSDQQVVRVMKAALDADVYHVASPILTNYVFREAELVNTSDQDFLAGPVSVYLNGRFVGRTEVPTVARGQTFVLGFGADPQLRTRRELVKKSESVQGGNRELSFAYRLVVENYQEKAVVVRVIDRLPYSEREAEIRVTLEEMDDKLSDNPFYLRRERPKGILRWQVEVPAGAAGEEARVVEYAYSLEFDRNLVVATPQQAATPGELEDDLQMLEQFRLYQH